MRDRSSAGDFIRGVDSLADKAKRGVKAWLRVCIVGFVVMLTVAAFHIRYMVPGDAAHVAWKYFNALLVVDFAPRRLIVLDLGGQKDSRPAREFVDDPLYTRAFNSVVAQIGESFVYGAGMGGILMAVMVAFAFRSGQKRRQDEKLRGGDRLEAEALIQKMEKEKSAGPLCIGRAPSEPQEPVHVDAVPAALRAERVAQIGKDSFGVMLPIGAETAHIGICGASRTGKSLTLQIMLNSVVREGQTAVVYDPHLDLFARYFDPGCGDVVLNAMDARCPVWTPWAEIRHPADADAIAESFIPDRPHSNNPYFDQAARLIFTAALLKIPAERRSAGELAAALLSLSNAEIKEMAGSLEAGRLMDAKSADEVRASLAVGIRALKYLRAGCSYQEAAIYRSQLAEWKAAGGASLAPKNPSIGFSLGQWLRDVDGRQPVQGERFHRRPWVWIIARGDHQAAIRPLVTTWFDVAARTVLSMESNLGRRIFLCVEEMPQIGKVPALGKLLAEGGKFGVAFVGVWQAWSQMVEVWGREGAASLLGNLSTFLAFRQEDPTGKQVYEDKFSEVEQREATESLRLGASDDNAVQVSDTKQKRALVIWGEMTGLETRHAFLKLPGQPITFVRQPDPNMVPYLPAIGSHPRQVDLPVEATVYGRLLEAPAPAPAKPADAKAATIDAGDI